MQWCGEGRGSCGVCVCGLNPSTLPAKASFTYLSSFVIRRAIRAKIPSFVFVCEWWRRSSTYPGTSGRMGLIEEGEDLRLGLLPQWKTIGVVRILPSKLARNFFVRRELRLDVQFVQDCQRGLGMSEYIMKWSRSRRLRTGDAQTASELFAQPFDLTDCCFSAFPPPLPVPSVQLFLLLHLRLWEV